MELPALLVLCGVGVTVIAVVLLMGLFSASGTSYEEAIAQQRRATTELLALADNKGKAKKTNKKANKKLAKKEKNKDNAATATASEPESEAPAESGVEDEPAPAKPHVEFSPPVVVDVATDTPPNIKIRKRGKDPKVKPILLNKEDPSCVSDPSALPSPAETAVSNHFEEMQPKDEFELLHSTLVGEKSVDKKEEITEKKDSKASKPAKGGKAAAKQPTPEPVKDEGSRDRQNSVEPPKEQRKVKKVDKKPPTEEPKKEKEKEKEEEEVVPPLNAPQPSELTTDKLLKLALPPAAPAPFPPAAKNKKKKPEPNVLSLMAGESGNVAVSELVRVIREAALSRTEIQILTDALLNKHHDQLPEHSEWTEGPNDPIQKLKKQLADKEKALADEIETHKGANNMLKELRATLAAERAKASGAARAAEAQAAALRAENNTLQKRLSRLADESTSLARDNSVLQSKLAAEAEAQAQRVQLEMHIQRLSDSEAGLLAQLAALQAELSARVLEAGQARCDALHAQQHAADLAQQLQEANRAYSELEQQRQCAALADQQAQQAQQDLRLAQDSIAALTEEIQRLTARAQAAEGSLDKAKEEAEKQNQQVSRELSLLREQLSAREAELAELRALAAASAAPSTPAAHNGLPPAALTEKAAELAKVESMVESLRNELAAAQRGSAEQRDQLTKLQDQLEHYKEKNNELRTKNWKVMEALQSAEKALQTKSASALPAQDVAEAIAKAQETQYMEIASVLRAACPAASPAAKTPGFDWLQAFADNLKKELEKKEAEKKLLEKEIDNKLREQQIKLQEQMEKQLREKELAEKEIRSRLERLQQEKESEKKRFEKELEKKVETPAQAQASDSEARLLELVAQNEQLQAAVDKYKRIVDDTESVLSRLQENVWREEQRWAQQLAAAHQDLDRLRTTTLLQEPLAFAYSCIEKSLPTIIQEMQKKIDSLQAELDQKQSNYSNSFADTERLSQERIADLSGKDVHNGPLQVGFEEK